jgi:hypothetical protein
MDLVDMLVTNRLANCEENRMELLTAREYTSRFKLPQEKFGHKKAQKHKMSFLFRVQALACSSAPPQAKA